MSLTRTPPELPFPLRAIDELQPAVTRYSSLPTPSSVKANQMFGIPLKSALTGETLPDSAIESAINSAISELEHTLDISITPVRYHEKHDYIQDMFSWSYNYTKLDHSPIVTVENVEISFSNDPSVPGFISFPLEQVMVMGQEGTIQLVPAFGTSLSGFLLSAFSGANYAALRAIGMTNFPGGIRITYVAGFPIDKVPAGISKLIEVIAAIQTLSMLGPILIPYNSIGVSIDGVSQSTGSAGVRHFEERLNWLVQERDRLMEAIKGYYQKRFLVDHF